MDRQQHLRKDIEKFHTQLNHAAIIPEEYYRRNSGHYVTVCYINTLIGLYLSENDDVIPTFIDRAYQHLQWLGNHSNLPSNEYYQLVQNYLITLARYIKSCEHVTISGRRLPTIDLLIQHELVSSIHENILNR